MQKRTHEPEAKTKAERILAEQRIAAFDIDRYDPDNWMKIPEFRVSPKDVSFEGFAFPIVRPNEKNYGLKILIRQQVTMARSLIRKTGFSQQDVKSLTFAAFENVAYGKSDVILSLDGKGRIAVFYSMAIDLLGFAIGSADNAKRRDLNQAHSHVAQASDCVRTMMMLTLNDPDDKYEIERRVEQSINDRLRVVRSKAGLAGANAKHATARELKEWALAEYQRNPNKRNNLRRLAEDISSRAPKDLMNNLDDPIRVIYSALLAANK